MSLAETVVSELGSCAPLGRIQLGLRVRSQAAHSAVHRQLWHALQVDAQECRFLWY